MVEAQRGAHCENCIERNSITLLGLARQYVAGEDWLHNPGHRMVGGYSLPAIHAMDRRIDTDRSPFDIRGPFLREERGIIRDEELLFSMQAKMREEMPNPQDIRVLADITRRRQREYDEFLNRGKGYWDERAKKVQQFLDQFAKRDPTESFERRSRFQRVYWLDQGAFMLAKTALGSCEPWIRLCPFGEKYQRFHPPLPRQR